MSSLFTTAFSDQLNCFLRRRNRKGSPTWPDNFLRAFAVQPLKSSLLPQRPHHGSQTRSRCSFTLLCPSFRPTACLGSMYVFLVHCLSSSNVFVGGGIGWTGGTTCV